MAGLLMVAISFFILVIITLISRNITKKEIQKMEYEEWMEQKGYLQTRLELYNEEELCELNNVVTDRFIDCYIHTGILNFVISKHVFSEIEIYPILPNNANVKETKPYIINTGIIKSVECKE